jgi:hypothetical protein
MNRIFRVKQPLMLLAFCLLAAGCATLDQRPGGEAGQAKPIQIGTIGDKRYKIKGLVVRTSNPVCDVKAYVAGFRNGLVNRWDTNVMMDRLPKSYYLDLPPESFRKLVSASGDGRCEYESFVTGEADGDKAGKKLYGEFLQKLNSN